MPDNDLADNLHVNKVAVRAPPFWPDEPELWFVQLESQFVLAGIIQDGTKYAHVLSQIDNKFAREIKDVITNPPAADKYQAIKTALIQRLSSSQEQRIRKLLEHEELGDRKPSQFLRHLQSLARANIPEPLLRTLWLGRLPAQMQVILATRTQDRLEEVAEQADRIQEVTYRSVAEVTLPISDQSRMEQQIRQLTNQIAEMSRRLDRKYHPQRRARSKSQERRKQGGPCFYHRRFGKKRRRNASSPAISIRQTKREVIDGGQ
ncbi:hypothetical protein EAI_00180 [Harpegnathos saltator]|uniref:DUF7041 domain-containing protein n=1 Tax=Harpegnathos saltator TaxID=610380 RepID=E2BBH0_HARSA|nr:hypothetical protein EAI_00180 [Harpegnathos saltator]